MNKSEFHSLLASLEDKLTKQIDFAISQADGSRELSRKLGKKSEAYISNSLAEIKKEKHLHRKVKKLIEIVNEIMEKL